MPNPAVPYHLTPKNTVLPAGHDDSLDPATPPTDPARRGVSLLDWVRADASLGPVGAPDAPAGAPATDPMVRALSPFEWTKIDAMLALANAPVRETVPPIETLDPDIALWPVILWNIFPFTGAPATGVWPKGWAGIDNTATPYICIEAGEPGTWAALVFAAANLTSDARSLSEDYSCTGTLTTFLTTGSLAAGTWLVNFTGVGIAGEVANDYAEVQLSEGTATATFAGATSSGMLTGADSDPVVAGIGISCIATISAPGTLVFQAKGVDSYVRALTQENNYPGATGYTAVKIA